MQHNKYFVLISSPFALVFIIQLTVIDSVGRSDVLYNLNELIGLYALEENNTSTDPTPDKNGDCVKQDCIPGGQCVQVEDKKVCKCFPGVRGKYCEVFDECIQNPTKCGDGNDVKCYFNYNSRKPYCQCLTKGQRFDVPLKKCVNQTQCDTYKDCVNGGSCEEEGDLKYCKCIFGTSGDYCERIQECIDNPSLCGEEQDVQCKFNAILERPFCKCHNGTQRFDLPQKKCIDRNTCDDNADCLPFGVCSEKCQSFEPCSEHDYFEGKVSCHCIEGTSGDKCEIVDDCYNKEVHCGTGDNVDCTYWYVSGFKGRAYCKCKDPKYQFDKTSKLCKECDCGELAYSCQFSEGKKKCTCKEPVSYNAGDRCEDCNCGEGSNGCSYKKGKKECYCKGGFSSNNDTCERCDCGENSSDCMFENGRKVCTCQPGFAVGNYGVCTQMCTDTHKCANGGLCLQDICVCLAGTGGPFCETVYDCEDKLCGEKEDVYCRYDTDKQRAFCQCRDDEYDPYDKSCKKCICDRSDVAQFKLNWDSCEYVLGKKVCQCKKGYEYNPKPELCNSCNCGVNGTCFYTQDGEKTCKCDIGYKEYAGSCFECNCGEHGECSYEKYDIYHQNKRPKICKCDPGYKNYEGTCVKCYCGANGKCVYSNGKYMGCACDEGFSDSLGICKFCYCGPNSKCIYDNLNKKICSCPVGFIVSKGYCIDIDECLNTRSCPDHDTMCVNTLGSFKCDCKAGFFDQSYGKSESSQQCIKEAGEKPDYSPWKIGYAIISVGFIVIIIGLLAVIYKIYKRRP